VAVRPRRDQLALARRPRGARGASGGGEELLLGPVVLGLSERAFLHQVVEFVEFVGGRGLRGGTDVVLRLVFGFGLGAQRAFAHVGAVDDQVDERRQVRDEDQQDDPRRFQPQ